VTAGYTVENYVPPEVLRAALEEVHPRSDPTWDGEIYLNPLGQEQLGDRSSPADKAAVAQAVVQRWSGVPDWPLDLRERVEELATMVRRANDLT